MLAWLNLILYTSLLTLVFDYVFDTSCYPYRRHWGNINVNHNVKVPLFVFVMSFPPKIEKIPIDIYLS